MAESQDISPTSGFILPPVLEHTNQQFTDLVFISSGGFNFLAKAKRSGRWWALKGLLPTYRNQTVYQQLLKKEYEILNGLGSHPSIVTAYSLEQVDELGWCIVMEWIEGETLAQWLDYNHSRIERRHVAELLIDAIDYVHSQQTAHRDLKPQNIMLTNGGKYIKLIDFGLGDTANYAILKEPAGTEGYMAPDGPSDIYSLGCILQDLRLGWIAKAVISKCKAPRLSRYHSVNAVRKALQRREKAIRYAGSSVLVLAVVGLFTFFILYANQSTREQLSEQRLTLQDSISSLQDELSRQRSVLRDSIVAFHDGQQSQATKTEVQTDSLQRRIKEQEIINDETKKTQTRLAECLEKGKSMIDDNVRKSGMEEFMDTVSSQVNVGLRYVEEWEKHMQAIDHYVQSLPPEFSDNERDDILSRVQDYFTLQYYLKWKKRTEALPPI